MSEQIIKLTPDRSDCGDRLDKYISEELEEVSRSYVKKLIESDRVRIIRDNPVKKLKPSYIISEGDEVEVTLPEPEKLSIEAENIPLDIVFEDDDIIIINKPQGMVVHPAPGNYTGTLVNALMYHCGDSLSSINGAVRPGIVHRIDKDTSGLLVVCKTNLAHQSLAEQFAEHSINRVYSAVVYNHFDTSKMNRAEEAEEIVILNESEKVEIPELYTETVNKPIARAKTDRKKMAIDADGRRAVTHIYLMNNLKDNMAFVRCKLETGRTHQIRVHLTSINHPLLGDPVYGPKSCPYNLKGQMLHAGTLGFVHPRTKEYIEFRSELPEYFSRLLGRLS